MSFTEFTYPLMQAHDFLTLHRDHGVRLQLGGTDQWGNITAGIDLVRRVESKEVFGMTMPLLTTASGQKMGKSAGNAVWLDADRTSPFELYQYCVQLDDELMPRVLRTLTMLPEDEIMPLLGEDSAPRAASNAE